MRGGTKTPCIKVRALYTGYINPDIWIGGRHLFDEAAMRSEQTIVLSFIVNQSPSIDAEKKEGPFSDGTIANVKITDKETKSFPISSRPYV